MELLHKKTRWLIGFTVMPLCFYLSFSLFKLAKDVTLIEESFIFFKNDELAQTKRLSARAKQLREQKTFMVFDKERVQLELALVNTLKKQINIQPFDVSLWRELIFLQASDSYLKRQENDQRWSFSVAVQLLGWNSHEQVTLLKRCAYFSVDLGVDVLKTCADLFKKALNKDSSSSLARKLNIKNESLQRVLLYFGVIEVNQQ